MNETVHVAVEEYDGHEDVLFSLEKLTISISRIYSQTSPVVSEKIWYPGI